MIAEVRAVLWKEWRELLRAGPGCERGSLTFGIGVLFLGAWSAGVIIRHPFGSGWQAGLLCAAMAALTAASVAGDSFAGERERRTLETLLASCLSDREVYLGKIAAVVSYGAATSLLFVISGMVASRIIHGSTGPLLPLLAGLGLSFLTAALVAGIGVLMSLTASTVRQAQQMLMLSLTGLGVVPYVVLRFLPAAWKASAAGWIATMGSEIVLALAVVLALLGAGALWLGAARFRRERLILS